MEILILIAAAMGIVAGFLWGMIFERRETNKIRNKFYRESEKVTALLHFVGLNAHRFSEQEMRNFDLMMEVYQSKRNSADNDWPEQISE